MGSDITYISSLEDKDRHTCTWNISGVGRGTYENCSTAVAIDNYFKTGVQVCIWENGIRK